LRTDSTNLHGECVFVPSQEKCGCNTL
jgi:hypothetical protein